LRHGLAEAFDRVNWAKLTQIPKGTEIDWREKKFISKMCKDQSVKTKLDRGQIRNVKIGRGARQGWCLSQILFNLHRDYLSKDTLEGFKYSQVGHVIRTVKYADDLVLLATEEAVLQGVIAKLTEII
jgi:hypothetical protein